MILSDDEIDLLFEVLDTACEAVASDFDLLDTEGAAPAEDEEIELDEGQVQALEWLQRVIGLRERLENQSALGPPREG
jgi:hypothetical protein